MKKILLIITLFLSLGLSGCSLKNKIFKDKSDSTSLVIEKDFESFNRTFTQPKSNIILGDRVVIKDGEVVPIYREFVDPTSKQKVSLEVKKDGQINVVSITQPDIINETKTTINENKTEVIVDNKTKTSDIDNKINIPNLFGIILNWKLYLGVFIILIGLGIFIYKRFKNKEKI